LQIDPVWKNAILRRIGAFLDWALLFALVRKTMPAGHICVSGSDLSVGYHRAMHNLLVNISWEYFLGVIGALTLLRFARKN
jgi:hypothetical protein